MPYITKEARDRIGLSYKGKGSPQSAGEMNYLFSIIMKRYLVEHGWTYAKMNDCIGALDAAKLEFYRRVVGPHENVKAEEHGDVY